MPLAPDVVTQDPSSRLRDILKRTQGWARLIAIIWMCGSILMILAGVVGGLGLAAAGRPEMIAAAFLYPVIGALYFLPANYLLRFANKARTYVQSGTQSELEEALDSQRSFWKFFGVMTLIAIGLMVLAFIAGIVMAGALARQTL
ncbi:MAG: hypothetical protein EPO35_08985 [Acidobacteria bacterium]|nr:MAG: hypothetical protein EPO35_08985 [Acidobacteriota bacterium]